MKVIVVGYLGFLLLYLLIMLIRNLPLSFTVDFFMSFFLDHGVWLITPFLFSVFVGVISPGSFGYALTDDGIAYCNIRKDGSWHSIMFVRWDEITCIKYRETFIKSLWRQRLTLHSTDGRSTFVDDNVHNFQEILQIIHDKVKMVGNRFSIDDSHKITIFEKSPISSSEKRKFYAQNKKAVLLLNHDKN